MRILSLLVVGLLAAGIGSADARSRSVVVYPVQDSFENAAQEVSDAIVKRGYVIDYVAQIGAMLERTAKDVGASKRIYGDARAMQFCSATLSRRTMEADPDNIGLCPHVVFVYSLPNETNKAYIGYRPLPRGGSRPSRRATRAVNKLLDDIAREAARRR